MTNIKILQRFMQFPRKARYNRVIIFNLYYNLNTGLLRFCRSHEKYHTWEMDMNIILEELFFVTFENDVPCPPFISTGFEI